MNRKRARRIFLWIASSLVALALLFAAAGWIVSYSFEEEVRTLFVREVNKRINTEIAVKRIHLSVFRHFPYASVSFYEVTIKDPLLKGLKTYLLKANEVSLEFSIADLLRSNFSISRMRLQDADLRLHVYPDGSDNFHILKASKNTGSDNFKFDIRKMIISRTNVAYLNEAAGQDYLVEVGEAIFSGMFSQDKYDLELQGNVLFKKIISQGTTFTGDRKANLDLLFSVDNNTGQYTLHKGDLDLGNLNFGITGGFIYTSSNKQMNIAVQSSEANLKDLLKELPPAYRKYFREYKADGKFVFKLNANGQFGGNNLPALTASFSLKDGSLKRISTGIALRDLNFDGQFNGSQSGKAGTIFIRNLSASLQGGTIKGNLKLFDFGNPMLEGNIVADANLTAIYGFIPVGYLTALSGKARINASFVGRANEGSTANSAIHMITKATGTIALSGASAAIKGSSIPVSDINGEFVFNNNDLRVNRLTGRYGSSDFSVQGAFRNFMACLLKPTLLWQLDARLSAGTINWDEVMAGNQTDETGPPALHIPANLTLNLDATISKLIYRSFTAHQIHGQLDLKNGTLTATQLSFDAMKGRVTAEGTIDGLVQQHGRTRCHAHLENVDITQMFQEFGDFGNTTITAKNLEGRLTTNLDFAARWIPGPYIDVASAALEADVVVENGRLKDYQPMQSLSKYLRVEDLSDIRFSTLTNRIEIANKIVYIPQMEIHSSALDLNLYGKHGFDNSIEYHFRILLSQLLSRKAHKNNPDLQVGDAIGKVQDDGLGRTTLYLILTGTVDEPIFKYDKKDVKAKIASDFKKERQNLKNILRSEFAPGRKDSVLDKPKKDETKFEIEWDDDKK
jgi:hypothetical protein